MCVTIAVAFGNWAVLSADTRHSAVDPSSGTILPGPDLGGRLLPVQGGWITASGDARLGALGLGRVLRVREGLYNLAGVHQELERVRREYGDEAATGFTAWLVARACAPPEVYHFAPDRSAGGPARVDLAWPPAIGEAEQADFLGGFRGAIARAPAPAGIVRATLRLAGQVADRTELVSRELEIGVAAGGQLAYARLPVEAAGADDRELPAAFRAVDPARWQMPDNYFTRWIHEGLLEEISR